MLATFHPGVGSKIVTMGTDVSPTADPNALTALAGRIAE
jgi:hypothetical protein